MSLDFKEFLADNPEAWKDRILKELKGKPYEALVWDHPEGMQVNPNSFKGEVSENKGFPGKFPYLRGVKTESNDWEINQFIASDTEAKMNKRALNALEGGAEGLIISLKEPKDLTQLLKGVFLNYVGLHFVDGFTQENMSQLEKLLEENELTGIDIYGSTELHLYDNELNVREDNIFLAIEISQRFPRVKAIKVRGDFFHNKGAIASTELALALSIGHESLLELVKGGMTVDQASAAINFSMGSGSSYFTELAKYRVLRQLWGMVVDKYEPQHSCSRATYIQAFSGNWNKTILDEENNLLRTTTEAMSAVLGGADAVCLFPFDVLTKQESNAGMRYARNIQHLLKSESFLHQTLDPAGGSYYIESLTKKLREKAWEKFCNMESDGGIIALQRSGKIMEMLKADVKTQKEALTSGHRTMIGVNKYKSEQAKKAISQDDRLAKDFEG
jgi:methylmalonyl-CoA mutase